MKYADDTIVMQPRDSQDDWEPEDEYFDEAVIEFIAENRQKIIDQYYNDIESLAKRKQIAANQPD